jgi:uncharacterized protein
MMARKRKTKVKCPICKQPVASGSADFPFCSERCRLIDLGKWAGGQYVVSSPVHDISDEMDGPELRREADED